MTVVQELLKLDLTTSKVLGFIDGGLCHKHSYVCNYAWLFLTAVSKGKYDGSAIFLEVDKKRQQLLLYAFWD